MFVFFRLILTYLMFVFFRLILTYRSESKSCTSYLVLFYS